jgi:hypothetical protein
MRDINLPRHVMDCFERRWAARFANAGAKERVEADPSKPPHIRRMLKGASRPPSLASVAPSAFGCFQAEHLTTGRAGKSDDYERLEEP